MDIEVLRGAPTEEELAAVVAVLLLGGRVDPAPRRGAGRWRTPGGGDRPPITTGWGPGPRTWRHPSGRGGARDRTG